MSAQCILSNGFLLRLFLHKWKSEFVLMFTRYWADFQQVAPSLSHVYIIFLFSGPTVLVDALYAANTKFPTSVDLLLGHSLWRWPNIKSIGSTFVVVGVLYLGAFCTMCTQSRQIKNANFFQNTAFIQTGPEDSGAARNATSFIIKLYSETQVSGRLGMSGGISPRHAQNPLSGERRKTLSITHHALSPPPSHHYLYIIHLINWLQRFYRIIMSLKRPFVPKSDVKQWFTTTIYKLTLSKIRSCQMLVGVFIFFLFKWVSNVKYTFCNFHPLEVVSRWRDPQLQVSDEYHRHKFEPAQIIHTYLKVYSNPPYIWRLPLISLFFTDNKNILTPCSYIYMSVSNQSD